MIPQLTNALSQGINPDQIIEYIIRKFPSHANKIKSVMSQGFTADQILQYLSGGKKALAKSDYNRIATTEYEATRSKDIASQEKRQNRVLAGGALAAGSLAAPMASAALQRAVPTTLAPLIQGMLPKQVQQQSQNLPQQPPVAPVNIAPNIPQVAGNVQAQGMTSNLGDVLVKHTSKDQIDKLIASGNGPKEVAGFLEKFKPKEVKFIEQEAGQPLEKVVEDYVKANPKHETSKVEEVIQPEKTPESSQKEELRKTRYPATKQFPTEEEWKIMYDVNDDEMEKMRDHAREPKHERMNPRELKEHNDALKRIELKKGMRAKETKEKTKTFEKEMAPILKDYREKQATRKKEELESIKGFDMKELDQLMDNGLEDAAHEIEKGISSGQKYFTHTGQEWKAVGHEDVTEGEEYPKHGKAMGKESFQEVIEKYLPVQALYQRYKSLDPRVTSDRFMKRLEKSIIDLLSKAA